MAFLQLFILVTFMSITTFFLGSLPFSLSSTLSPVRFHQLSIFSVGLLIGAALTIVIPEGIDTIYNSSAASNSPTSPSLNQTESDHDHDPKLNHHHQSTIGLALMAGFMLMFLIDQLTRIPFTLKKKHSEVTTFSLPTAPENRRGSSDARVAKLACSSASLSSSQTTRLLSDEGRTEAHSHNSSEPSNRSEEQEEEDDDELGVDDEDRMNSIERGRAEPGGRKTSKSLQAHSFSTVIGLLTHSVADGIALGASSTHATRASSKKGLSLELIIFLAIMVHKAPAAFGMVMVLLAEGLSTSSVRKILAAFSLAAPVGALTTWSALILVQHFSAPPSTAPTGTIEKDVFQWWIGITLLFSAGTFLFVATHALQSTSSNPIDPCCPKLPLHAPSNPTPDPEDTNPHPQPDAPSSDKVSVGPLLTCALMVSGMCFPWLLTQLVGTHHH